MMPPQTVISYSISVDILVLFCFGFLGGDFKIIIINIVIYILHSFPIIIKNQIVLQTSMELFFVTGKWYRSRPSCMAPLINC